MGSLIFFPRYSKVEIQQLNQVADKAIQAAERLRDYLDQFPVKQQRKMLERIRECDSDPDYQPWGGLFRHPNFPQRRDEDL